MRKVRMLPTLAALLIGIGTVAPAHAADAMGSGLVRIDGNWATVKTLADGSTVLTFAKDATGQWMGEIGPDNRLAVRDIDDERLVRAWKALGHGDAPGVVATATWNQGANYAALTISQPTLTPRGHLRFTLSPGTELPARLTDVDINIVRSQSRLPRSFPVSERFAITATASALTSLTFAYSATVTLSDNGLNCSATTVSQPAPQAQLPANLACGSLTFNTGQYTMGLPSPTQQGTILMSSTMTASGSSFDFNSVIATWSVNGK